MSDAAGPPNEGKRMKKLFLALAGILLALTGVAATATSAQAVPEHINPDSWTTVGTWGSYDVVLICSHGEPHVAIWGRDDKADGAHVEVWYNRSWVNDGWKRAANAVGSGNTDHTDYMWTAMQQGDYLDLHVELWDGNFILQRLTTQIGWSGYSCL